MSSGSNKVDIIQLLIQHVKDEWVMWPLVLLSVIMFTIVLERMLVIILDRVKLSPSKFADLFVATLEKNKGDKMKTVEEMEAYLAKKKENIAVGLFKKALRKYKDGVDKKLSHTELRGWIKDAVEDQAVVELPALEAHLGWLAVISNVATLMGLFGTVYGMIQAFYSMSQSVGGVKADEMAGGIAVALIATLFGLLVAIPSLILYNYIKNVSEEHVVRLEESVQIVIDKLIS